MAALFDTTVGVLLLRRNPPEDAAALIRVARAEIVAGTALLPAVATAELLVGEKRADAVETLRSRLSGLPTAVLPTEAAEWAGSMGAFLRSVGASVPLPDLLIAATAVWLEIPLLTWDGDYCRARTVASRTPSGHPGAKAWLALDLHPVSRLG